MAVGRSRRMVHPMRGQGTRLARSLPGFVAVATSLLLAACTWLPAEFNCSPLYRHRLDEQGRVLELDVLWPIFHYELSPEGGDDLRIRPLWRRVVEPVSKVSGARAVEHQFLWPLGRVRHDAGESSLRFFPLLWHRSRTNDAGQREADWYCLFPFIWGGSREDGQENYFGVFPIAGSFPDFLTYRRFTFVLWPLYLHLEKERTRSTIMLWPFIGWGSVSDGTTWHRFIPLWSVADGPRRWYRSILWPVFSWGVENLDGDDPVFRWFVWPLFGRQTSREVFGWTVLFPLFQSMRIADRHWKVDFLWPIFRSEERLDPENPLFQWWVFPLVARTITDDQWAWNFLWPLIWLREYHDPEDLETQQLFVPFFSHTHREGRAGITDWLQIWPFLHRAREDRSDGVRRGEWSFLSPWPWHGAVSAGLREAFGWAWEIARADRRGAQDSSFELMAHLYSTRKRGERRQTSVPFLFNWESDASGGTLRLLQVIPIPFGGGEGSR